MQQQNARVGFQAAVVGMLHWFGVLVGWLVGWLAGIGVENLHGDLRGISTATTLQILHWQWLRAILVTAGVARSNLDDRRSA